MVMVEAFELKVEDYERARDDYDNLLRKIDEKKRLKLCAFYLKKKKRKKALYKMGIRHVICS
ncbi:hypothetical protein GCM10020331_061730 [Ectobacillus funiculus]